ncbi:Mkp-4, partial [Chytridium lagenaria]
NSASLNFYPDGPATILPNLLLGSEQNASDVSILSRYNVKCVLNVAKEVTNPLLEAKALPWSHAESDLLTQFTRAFTYIDAAVSQNLPVLVACQQGVSRSASLVIAYVMATKRMTLEESYEYVKKCSPNVCPNVGFMAQLVEFEMMLKK